VAPKRRMTGLIGLGTLLLATGAVHAQPAPAELANCLALDAEGEIRSCADKYIARACQASPRSPSLLECLKARNNGAVDAFRSTPASKAAYDACQAEQAAFQRAPEPLGCANAARARVAARVNAGRSCIQSGEVSICVMLPDQKVASACYSQCIDARETAMHTAADREQDACESRYIEAQGRGKATCTLPGAMEGIDLDAATFNARMKAAILARDLDAIDALIKQSDGQFLWDLQTDCTKACNDRASKLLAIQKQGPAFVAAYKRCMVAADSTLEARKLAVNDTDLYCDYLQKADTRCRAANRCEWIEQLSDMRCTYASPDVGRCQ
jgi:hypothetical protein